ncbi:MAG: hypothetical protein M1839_004396 [Geoglossum umbratile]|nr:MAG: hypothetical protein M1839_004396 [Geoglossum umbratile]
MATVLPALLRPSIVGVGRAQWTARHLFGRMGDGIELGAFGYLQHGQLIRPFSISSKPFRRRPEGPQCHSAIGILLPFQRQTSVSTSLPSLLAALSTSKRGRHKPPKGRPPKGGTTPKNISPPYDPDLGVPFRPFPLTPPELHKIFGTTTLPPNALNLILRIQHGRRIHGLLEVSDSEFASLPQSHPHIAAKALGWLRENYPMDEEAAAEIAMEGEEQRALRMRAERLGLYKPQGGVREGGSVYGRSELENIREANERETERREEERRIAEEEEKASTLAIKSQPTAVQTGEGRVGELTAEKGEPSWVTYYRERAMVTNAGEPPKMSKLRRILPSLLLTLLTISLSIAYTATYVPPSSQSRLFPTTPPTTTTLLTLLASNALIFFLWRIPPAWPFLNRYFISVPGYPYAFSILGNMFSHQQFRHLALNMAVLWIMGSRVHEELGRGAFLGIYFSSGAIASLLSLSAHVFRNNLATSSLGASGAIAGILATWFSIHGKGGFEPVFVPEGLVPSVSGWAILGALIGVEMVGIARGWRRVDHWAHLGGYVGGIASGWWVGGMRRQRVEERKRREKEKGRGWLDRVREGRW